MRKKETCKVVLIFDVDEILWYDHSKESSSVRQYFFMVLRFSIFYTVKNVFFVFFFLNFEYGVFS